MCASPSEGGTLFGYRCAQHLMSDK